MATATSPKSYDLYLACCQNDFKTIQENLTRDDINAIGPEGNTALHAASSHGHGELVRHLLWKDASRTIQNADGRTPEQVAMNQETLAIFSEPVRLKIDSNHFLGSENEVEWLDSYKNAYRISYENHEHMKRWLTKVPLKKLLEEIDSGYIKKIQVKNPSKEQRENLQMFMELIKDYENPLGLLQAYTDPGFSIFASINRDLAEFGSDFRFVSTQALINSGYLDNEAPTGLGQYIFAAILINHRLFCQYHHTGKTYRGMNITETDLQNYKKDDIIMTRSFLSTSIDRNVAEVYLDFITGDKYQQVICIYKVINPRSSLYIRELSKIPCEEEVLIIPFTVFEVQDIRNTEVRRENKTCRVTEIELEERFNPT